MFKHLRKVNMTYSEHLLGAFSYSGELFKGSIKSFIHGIFPNLYETSTTDLVKKLSIKLNIK